MGGGTGGCMGSIPQLGYTYLQLFGHVAEEDWPYTSGSTTQTGDCEYDYNGMPPVVGLTGYNTLTANDQDAVMTHLAEVGPLAVAVYASGWGGYSGGVYDGCSYDSNIALNHAVQLVGYGTDESLGDYWIVRNSWGSRWGEDGYIRLARDSAASAELTAPLWTEPPAPEVPGLTSSTSVDSAEFSSTSPTLSVSTSGP